MCVYEFDALFTQVDFADTFKLFCTTRLPNPHFTPELCAKVTVVDFTVTMAGLEDQLLGKLILKEKHELEEQRQQLLEEVQSYKKKIKQLEDDLLFRRAHALWLLAWLEVDYCQGMRPSLPCTHPPRLDACSALLRRR